MEYEIQYALCVILSMVIIIIIIVLSVRREQMQLAQIGRFPSF